MTKRSPNDPPELKKVLDMMNSSDREIIILGCCLLVKMAPFDNYEFGVLVSRNVPVMSTSQPIIVTNGDISLCLSYAYWVINYTSVIMQIYMLRENTFEIINLDGE